LGKKGESGEGKWRREDLRAEGVKCYDIRVEGLGRCKCGRCIHPSGLYKYLEGEVRNQAKLS